MFSDIVEMFAFTKAQMRIPKANYEFDGWITIRNNAVIRCEEGSVFLPTFEPVGADRNTPLIDLGTGCDINYLKTHLVAGIDTIRTMVKVGGGCNVGRYIATSVNLNNNRAAGAADAIDAGALLIRGTGNAIGLVEVDMHDSVINIDNAFRTTIGRVIETNFVTGIAGRDSSIVAVGSVYAEGVDPSISLAMSTPRGNMTPGANAIVWGGVERVTVGDVEAYNILEHTIRLGAKQPSGTITNERHSYGNIKTFAPYGCGFKMDDADAFTIKRVQIKTLYTEDVGHNVWGQPNDGNKAGCAIRNAEFVQIGLYMNRAVNYANSGNDGLWVEKSKNVQIAGADVQNARGYGVLVNPNGSDIDHVTITGIRSAFNGKSGVGVITASNSNIRGVYLQGVSSNNTEYGVEVTTRTDGTSPFVTEPTTINITVRNNALGGKSVPMRRSRRGLLRWCSRTIWGLSLRGLSVAADHLWWRCPNNAQLSPNRYRGRSSDGRPRHHQRWRRGRHSSSTSEQLFPRRDRKARHRKYPDRLRLHVHQCCRYVGAGLCCGPLGALRQQGG